MKSSTRQQENVKNLNFHFMPGSRTKGYNHLKKLTDPIARLEYVSSKSPMAARWMDTESLKEFWRPKLGQIHVSVNEEFKRYPTITGAYREAVRIKKLMLTQLNNLKQVS